MVNFSGDRDENASENPKVSESAFREAGCPALTTTWWEWPQVDIVHL
jgi:hypothetical protein